MPTIYAVEGTKVQDMDFFNHPDIIIHSTIKTSKSTKTVTVSYKCYPTDIYEVDVNFLKPTVKINVEATSQIEDMTTTLKFHTNVFELMSSLEKENPGKSYYTEIIALGDLTKRNGFLFKEYTSLTENIPSYKEKLEEIVGQTLQQASIGIPYLGIHKYKAGHKKGNKDHLLFQYKINEIVKDGGPNRTVITGIPMVAEIRTVGSLSSSK